MHSYIHRQIDAVGKWMGAGRLQRELKATMNFSQIQKCQNILYKKLNTTQRRARAIEH